MRPTSESSLAGNDQVYYAKGNVWLMGPFVGGHSYRPLNANRVICRSMGISDVSRWTNDALINAAHNLVCGENAA